MLKVALTGNVASGKSTVVRVWQELGATVIDADQLARRAVEPGTPGLARIAEQWGPAVLTPDGTLNRAAMRELVFGDPDQRVRLEAIVHPEVARLRDEAMRAAQLRGERLVAADIPLLFEVGGEGEFDVVVLVDAPEATRLQRMVRDRGLDEQSARRLMNAQMPAESKRERADVVIDNSGSVAEVHARAREVWVELNRLATREPHD